MLIKTKVSNIINNLNVFDKWGSFNKPKFKAINNIIQRAISDIDKHIPNIDIPYFFLLV